MPRDDNPPTNGDMDYREFFDRFMGACRRKHIRREPELIELFLPNSHAHCERTSMW